jgi:uncharacterized SAM-binding protein YcdF (DUF218 family)
MTRIKSLNWRLWLGRIILVAIAMWLLIIIGLISLIHYTGTIDEAQSADVIIVLGAGLSNSGRPGWALTRRSAHAAELWKQGSAETIICTGGTGYNQSRSEADGCREVLIRNGVPSSAIILEENSRSTEENAIFSRQIMDANAWETALLVSDSYHVFRGRYIFSSQGIDVFLSPVPAQEIRGFPTYYSSVFREVLALHWQVFKDIFNLQVTSVPIV